MEFKIKLEDKLKLKFLLLIILYLLFFYFFIFKNILNYLEIKEYMQVEQIKINKLELENSELKKSLILKKETFEKERLLLEKIKEEKNEKFLFPKISDAFELINEYMNKNNIIFESFGRSQKNGNTKNISFSFRAFEKDCINFLKDLEESNYYFNLTDSYFSLSSLNSQILCKLSIRFKINDNFEKIDIKNNENENLFLKILNKDKNSSYMRIGNNKFYKNIKIKKEEESSQDNKNKKKD